MREVRFPAYRRYEARRVEASNAMMALLAGAGMVRDCLGLLEKAGRCTPRAVAGAGSLAAKHPLIERSTGGTFNVDSLGQLTTIRLMRNCMIHAGGRVDQALLKNLTDWTAGIEAGWVKLTGNNPRHLRADDELAFGHGEMILTLAVTRALGRETNHLLQSSVPRVHWADMVVDDLLSGGRHTIHAPDLRRRLHGLATFHYGVLRLTRMELDEALVRAATRG
jgi:hypothetical protein